MSTPSPQFEHDPNGPQPQFHQQPQPGSQPYTGGPSYQQQEYGYQQGYPGGQPQQGYGYASQQGYGYFGQQTYGGPIVAAPKSKVAAGLLGIFLGTFGVHNFYLGHTNKALVQLLLTILSFGTLSWVSWIWGLIEGILILTSRPGSEWHRDGQGIELTD